MRLVGTNSDSILAYGKVEQVKKITDKLVIYDHQKAGRDIPDTAVNFAKTMRDSGVDSAIIYPNPYERQTGNAYIEEMLAYDVTTLVGGWMTTLPYAQSEGGQYSDSSILQIYKDAVWKGITDFVVPGNKPNVIQRIRAIVGLDAVLYAPGIGAQGGEIADVARVAGGPWHGIVGRAWHASQQHILREFRKAVK